MLKPGAEIEVRDPLGRPSAYVVRGERGAGGQGVIYTLAAPDGRLAVLKTPGAKGVLGAEIERRILAALPPHRNIVRFMGTAVVQSVECAVLGYAHENPFTRVNDPRIQDALAAFRDLQAPRSALPATTAIEMVHEVLFGLEHLHTHGFVHGDVKASNVLVELASPRLRLPNREYFTAIQQRAYRTVLIDFGTTRSTAYLESAGEREEKVVPPEFTPLYAPPESLPGLIAGSRPSTTVDSYQVGLLLYELVTGHFPFDHVIADIAQQGLGPDLIDLKRTEAAGKRRPFDPERIVLARQHDVVFAEAFAAQRLRDRFYENVRRFIDVATSPDPTERPTITALRSDFIRIFELEPVETPAGDGRPVVAMTNPRWHLVRLNRLNEASRAEDAPETVTLAEPETRLAPPEPEPEKPAPEPPIPRPDPRGFRVALVDDDKVTLTILAGTLRRRGFRVRTFQDPEVALDVLSRDHPDVAVFDNQMPGLTGIELVKRLEERCRSQPFPIMILSSEGQEQTLAEAFHHGVTDYLVKPVSEAELVVKIEQARARAKARPPEAIPRELAGYELGDEIRRGEVAVIFRAASPDEPELVRAAKVLRPDLAGESEPLLRLRREIDVLSRSDHPGLARVLASGLVGRLLFYISDEVPLRTLGELVRERGRLTPNEAYQLLRDVGGALRHLHGRLIFHGDLTPETIAVKESGFVIGEITHARWLDGAVREDEPIPQPSRYTAPELAAAPSRPEPRSDLYSLGVCVLEAVTGRPLGPLGPREDLGRIAATVAPPELAQLLVRLVSRLPEDRFPSAAELLAAMGVPAA